MNRETFDCSEKFAEAWLSCMVLMVKGDVLSWTIPHTITALKVATSSVLAYAAVQMAFKQENPFINILLMALITALMDFNFHPTHFGPVWAKRLQQVQEQRYLVWL